MEHLPISGTVLECCAGALDIAMVLELYPRIKRVWANDINPGLVNDFGLDAGVEESWRQFPTVDFVVTNPPFNQAGKIVQLAHKYARRGVLMFLRQSFTEPTDSRGEWLWEHPPTVQIDLPRFKFRQGANGGWQTDCATICAFFWSKEGLPCRRIISPKSKIKNFYDRPDRAPAFDVVCRQVAL